MVYTKSKNKSPRLVILLIMLLGIGVIFFGVTQNLNIQEKTKNYVSVSGRFIQATFYSRERSSTTHRYNTTYSLTYAYKVDGKEYTVTTDYGTSSVPQIGSTKTIKYNSANPEEAIIVGSGFGTACIVVGAMFVGVMLIALLAPTGRNEKNVTLGKFKGRLFGVLFGLFFVGIGIGFYIITDSILPSIVCLVIGIIVLKPTVFSKSKILSLRVDRIEHAGLGNVYRIIFVDDNIEQGSFKALISRYYVYETTSGERFQEDRKYKVNIYKYSIVASTCYLEDNTQARILANFNDEDFEEDYGVI